MRRIGLDNDALLVAYDAANSLAASRLWWLLTDAGHRRVRVPERRRWPPGRRPGCRPSRVRRQASGPATSSSGPGSGPSSTEPNCRRPRLGGCATCWWMSGPPSATPARASRSTRWPATSPAHVNLPSMANVDQTGRFLDPHCCGSGIVRRSGRRCGALLRVRDHRRPQPAGDGVRRSDRSDLPRVVERVDHRSRSPGGRWGAAVADRYER